MWQVLVLVAVVIVVTARDVGPLMRKLALAIDRRRLIGGGGVWTDPVLVSLARETESIKTDAHPRALLRYLGQGDESQKSTP